MNVSWWLNNISTIHVIHWYFHSVNEKRTWDIRIDRRSRYKKILRHWNYPPGLCTGGGLVALRHRRAALPIIYIYIYIYLRPRHQRISPRHRRRESAHGPVTHIDEKIFKLSQSLLIDRILYLLNIDTNNYYINTNAKSTPVGKALLNKHLCVKPHEETWNYQTEVGMLNYLQGNSPS